MAMPRGGACFREALLAFVFFRGEAIHLLIEKGKRLKSRLKCENKGERRVRHRFQVLGDKKQGKKG